MRAPENLLPELPLSLPLPAPKEISREVQAEVRDLIEDARTRGADLSGDVSALLDEALVRGGAAWDALRGERVGPPVAHRRWPAALAAAAAGAAAGVAVAVLLRRMTGEAPGAQEPEELLAVVDRGDVPA